MATNASLPYDVNGAMIQTLAPDEDTVVQVSIAAGNNTSPLPTNAQIVEVASSDLCRIKFGDSGVDATSGVARLFPLGVAVYRVPVGATHVACTRVGTSTGLVTVASLK